MRHGLTGLALAAIVAWGCGSKSSERDTGTDTPADPGAEDASSEDAPPASCTGSESFTVEFVEDDSPVEGVAVVVRCDDELAEGASGTDGRVTFSGLNLSARPVDLTFQHEDGLTTWLAYGGARGAPEVIEVDLTEQDPTDDWVVVRGDVTHADPDSIMIVSGPLGVTHATGEDQYERRAPEGGTGLPMAFLEYTAGSGTATIIGFDRTTFDTPPSGDPGPTAVADGSATVEDIGVTLAYELTSGSPVADRVLAEDGPLYYTRIWFGLYLMDVYEDAGGPDIDYSTQVGLTTSWTRGSAADDLTLSYVPSGITGEATPAIIVTDHNGYWFTTKYPSWPIADGTTIDVRDVPSLAGVDPSVSLTMADSVDIAYPEWAAIVSATLYLSTGFGAFNTDPRWSVLVPPEGATFSFEDLPLPSSTDLAEVLPRGTTAPQIFLAVGAIEADGDPFTGYAGWIEDGWWDGRFLGRSVDGRYLFEP
jgi:hypothetical protein